jgi:DNA-binding response OmpR family regulator
MASFARAAFPSQSPHTTADIWEDEYVPDNTAFDGQTVMLIDDSIAVRRVIEASFQRANLPTTTFPDGLAAIQALSKGEVGVPTVLLLDIGLPRMTGYEVARLLKSHAGFEQTKIVMLTGNDGVLNKVHSRWVGACDFIAKPFRVSDLINVVSALLKQSSSDRGSGGGTDDGLDTL